MMPRQRQIIYELWKFWQQWGYAPTVAQLATATHCCDMLLADELRTLAEMKLIYCNIETNDRGYDFIKAKLTPKAEQMLPRIQELMQ
jgi:hypothetical protein